MEENELCRAYKTILLPRWRTDLKRASEADPIFQTDAARVIHWNGQDGVNSGKLWVTVYAERTEEHSATQVIYAERAGDASGECLYGKSNRVSGVLYCGVQEGVLGGLLLRHEAYGNCQKSGIRSGDTSGPGHKFVRGESCSEWDAGVCPFVGFGCDIILPYILSQTRIKCLGRYVAAPVEELMRKGSKPYLNLIHPARVAWSKQEANSMIFALQKICT